MRFVLFIAAGATGVAGLACTLRGPAAIAAIPIVLAIVFLTALSLGLSHSRAALASGLGVSAAPGIFGAVAILAEVRRDPTSHNLWPFELAMLGSAGSDSRRRFVCRLHGPENGIGFSAGFLDLRASGGRAGDTLASAFAVTRLRL